MSGSFRHVGGLGMLVYMGSKSCAIDPSARMSSARLIGPMPCHQAPLVGKPACSSCRHLYRVAVVRTAYPAEFAGIGAMTQGTVRHPPCGSRRFRLCGERHDQPKRPQHQEKAEMQVLASFNEFNSFPHPASQFRSIAFHSVSGLIRKRPFFLAIRRP